MNAFIHTFLLVYVALLPIVDPVGGAPLFLGFTAGDDPQSRNRLSLQIAINSFFLLLGSMLIGSHVLEFFGISLPTVQVGGGIVVTAFGWNLLNSSTLSEEAHPIKHSATDNTDAFYPLTMPLTVGPSSISVAITVGSQRPPMSDVEHFLIVVAGAVASLMAMSLTIYWCYRFAQRLVSMLGRGGTNVVVRLSAFILLCIGIQILWNGLRGLSHLT
jgi:multiple antibiotic resistance protein